MPPKRKKSKSRKPKSRVTNSKAARLSRGTSATRPKKTVKKKQSKKKSLTTSSARKPRIPVRRAQRLESSRASEGMVSGRQSGDLEGLSRTQQADSESVDELVEEGNIFEAGAVAGVEDADDRDTKEVRTREVPEDDVPDEYLDQE